MNDIDHACGLLKLAQADLKALSGMRDPETFTDAIFGFHAQQAIEKGLKAWLSILGAAYPKTHDLNLLLTLLEERNQEVKELWDLLYSCATTGRRKRRPWTGRMSSNR